MTQSHPRFISFEGPEGAGKTTQARVLTDRLRAAGRQVVLTREPGGTALGDRVRQLVLPETGLPITSRAETLLYCVARAQLVEERLVPSLSSGNIVIVDRYADSTIAYQAYGRGLDVRGVREVLAFATGGLTPDLTFLLDVPVDIGLRRKRSGPDAEALDEWNRFESEHVDFHRRVRDAYRQLASAEPERWVVLDASRPADEVAEQVWRAYRAAATRSDAAAPTS